MDLWFGHECIHSSVKKWYSSGMVKAYEDSWLWNWPTCSKLKKWGIMGTWLMIIEYSKICKILVIRHIYHSVRLMRFKQKMRNMRSSGSVQQKHEPCQVGKRWLKSSKSCLWGTLNERAQVSKKRVLVLKLVVLRKMAEDGNMRF